MCDISVIYKIASIAWCKTGHRPNGWQLIKLGQPSFCRSKIYKTSSKLYCLACMVRHHEAPETIEIYITAPSSTQKYKYIYIYIYTQVPPITRKCEYVLWSPQAPNEMYIDIFIMCFDMHAETPGP